MSCDDPDCVGCRLSKRKWEHRTLAFVLPPRPIGCNPYRGTPPVFGSQMSAAAGAGRSTKAAAGAGRATKTTDDEYEKRCDALDRRCDEPSDFIDEGNAAVKTEHANTVAEMQAELMKLKLEKKALMQENKAIMQAQIASTAAGVAGPGKKVNYTHTHPTRHVAVKEAAEPVLAELKKMTNNPDLIWWIAKHIEALSRAGEKPESHKSYKAWAKDMKNESLAEYMGWDVDAGADEDDE